MIKQFDKTNLKNVREDISAMLSKYAKENGIEFNLGNISFSAGEFNVKLSAKVKGAVTQDDAILNVVMATKGLVKTSKCGKTLIGYNTRGKAYPFIFENAGKKYKCSEAQAKMYFSK